MLKVYFVIVVLLSAMNGVFGTSYEYDSFNRLMRITYDSGFQISYSYDEVGNRTERIATIKADIMIDGKINLMDLSIISQYWLNTDCGTEELCINADLNHDGKIDIHDLVILSEYWTRLAGS
jgi:YD repeat-containing protein